MLWSREEHKDLFWAGFLAGAVVGGTVGVFLASEAGRKAYGRLEDSVQDLQTRFNGRMTAEEPTPAEESADPT